MIEQRVAVLAGGFSLEREASLRSGEHVLGVLRESGVTADLLEPGPAVLERVRDYDVAFLAIHGRIGEDGTIQSMLELIGVPYTGSTAPFSALAWDKPIAKGVLQKAGLPTPRFTLFSSAGLRELGAAHWIRDAGELTSYPVIVKPAACGSALGVTRVKTPEELPRALMHAMAYSEFVLIEECIHGTEIAVSILDGEPLPVTEIEPQVGKYDYAARYTAGATRFYIPARLDDAILDTATEVALQAWDALGARHLARVDMIVDQDGIPWILELSPCPGLISTSVFPMAADASGLGFPLAVQRLVEAAIRDA